MTTTYLTVTLIASIAALGGAVLNLTGHRIPVTEAQRLSVPMEWLRFPIGVAYALGLLGLLVGVAVPAVGIVAAAGFVALFVLAIGAHVRVGDRSLGRAVAGLALASATLLVTATWAAGRDDLGGVVSAYVNDLPDPWWPVVVLAVIQIGDAAMCFKPVGFIAQCFTDVGLPRALWPVMPWVKVAATAGLVAGLWVPYVGALTSAALVVYFVCAVSAHVRARDFGRNLALNATLSLVMCVAVFVFCFLR
ncbi:DoxX family protein [Nocardioides sp. YR527]|uniref:DoxX family protein n=1 Tax=Nocardioides sp. YR527 TaxID=1881028 RepID=UPI0015A25BDC|nr:DoxX family protein [Nocardioides sp. YR527]